MATNKNALMRYKVLDNCFRNSGKRYFIEDLIEECEKVLLEIDDESNGISRRQIFEDIAFMESKEGWKIELTRLRDGKRMYYRYMNTSYSINDMPLNEMEVEQLQSAISILSQFKGMPQFKWMDELLPKLKQGATTKPNVRPVISFDANQYLKGIDLLGELYNAICSKCVLHISYKDFKAEEPYDLVIHPYYLKQYNNRWFLFGFNPGQQKYNWNLALDRIVAIKEIKETFVNNDQIDWEEYFEDIIGVTKPDDVELTKVKLLFRGDTCKYITTKPLHGSQKHKWLSNDELEVELEIYINFELKRLILSYGEKVKVLAPTALSASVSRELKKASEQYVA